MSNLREKPQAGKRPNRAAMPGAQTQPMPNYSQTPQRMSSDKQIQIPKKRSALKKALPYIASGGSVAAAVGGVWGYVFFS
ncbi:hypothetical protein KKA95_04045 [Patescibacteria group bacterium]|nr:hypothetical protein [Patescibacteria group bacterium]